MLQNKSSRFYLVFFLFSFFLIISFFIRTSLALKSFALIDIDLITLLKTFGIGTFYDTIAFFYYILPLIIYIIFLPQKIFNSILNKYLILGFVFMQMYALLFGGVSEWFFWDEFGKRFNFIAVDYLVYTQEVIRNILESYPIGILLSTILLISISLFYLSIKKLALLNIVFTSNENFYTRIKRGFVFLLIPILAFNLLQKQELSHISDNTFNNELAKNGLYSLFSAFRNNSLDYNEFYANLEDKALMNNLQNLTGFSMTPKQISSKEKEIKPNVILIMVESLSAEYMGIYGNHKDLTPNLDSLTQKSLFFDNLYATGTRTIRGMEAVTLSIPPTPGRSIVKRPENEEMFSSGFIFQSKGYENKFIYAGHGYFDNINYFFAHNGFDIVDRTDFTESEITFSNAWGVCDEDLLNRVLKEADNSYSNGKTFFNYVMTTSNHRPYTYPDGKIDIPSHSGRDGAVKYTDFAIGSFLKEAQNKPWFENTIFVIVADHNGGSAGKSELPISKYKIPLIYYAPHILPSQTISKLSSQIDVMPTLFSLMHWNYPSLFYGEDILSPEFTQRAFIGTYQKLGYLKDDRLTILSPDKSIQEYKITNQTIKSTDYEPISLLQSDKKEAIIFYQSASYMYKHKLNKWKQL